jgi:hypothetical protein
MITEAQKQNILTKAQEWFRLSIAESHIANTEKLSDPAEFNINPFLVYYLANFLAGDSTKINIAKALVYPRVLGTSITTSFGTHVQKFTNDVLDAFGSTTSGIDIEFIDQLDNRKKYCQLKAGPNTINKDDVETLKGHFASVIRLSRTNNQSLAHDQLIVGVIYGDESQLNSHYKRLERQYHHPVFAGKIFWHRLTGHENFYMELAQAIGDVAIESNYSAELDRVIRRLARNLTI